MMNSQFRGKAYSGRQTWQAPADPQAPGHDRWLVSYADFMTLLMAFFVVMYSVSQVSEEKYRVLSETFSEAFKSPDDLEVSVDEGEPQRSFTHTPIDLEGFALEDRPGNDADQIADSDKPGKAENHIPAQFTQLSENLQQSFADERTEDAVNFKGNEHWLEITLPAEMLFEPGGTELNESAREMIAEVAAALEPLDNVVRVEGFTDNQAVRGGRYSSNWELSSARAISVVRQMVEQGIEPQRLAAVGFGEHQPVATNLTEAGRRQNRRIVVSVSTNQQFRDDVYELPRSEYELRPALPDGTLVYGLESSTEEQAREWLAARYPGLAPESAEESSQSLAAETDNGAAAVEADTDLGAAVQRVQLENGALLFTAPTAEP